MKPFSRKRLGLSGGDLVFSVFLSLFLHLALIAAAVLFYFTPTQISRVPPSIEVKLVGQPAEVAPAPLEVKPVVPEAVVPLPQKKIQKPKVKKSNPKAKKAAVKQSVAAPRKDVIPELVKRKQPSLPKQETAADSARKETSTASSVPVAEPAVPAGKSEGVEVTTPQQDFKFSWYLKSVSEKIKQNWRPPPDTKEAKARVSFVINRFGRVGDVTLDDAHTNSAFEFRQAAIRAIRSSNPFPPLPEEFSKQTLEFSVDLVSEE